MFKRLLLIFLILGAVTGGVLAYLWRQATSLPLSSPATATTHLLNDPAAADRARMPVWQKIMDQLERPGGTGEIPLNAEELNTLVTWQAAEQLEGTGLAPLVQSTHTRIQDGRLEVGAVVHPAALSPEQLQAVGNSAEIVRLVRQLPGVGDRPLYIGIEGTPSVQNGQVALDDNLRLKVGNLSFTMADVAQRLGVSEASLRQFLEEQANLVPVPVERVEVVGDRLVIQGR